MENTVYTHRYLARIVIEAETPLTVGSGEKNITTDALVVTDTNGLPYIPGTALAGIIRHAIGEEETKDFFGFQGTGKKPDGKGSEIIFSSAQLVNENGTVIDGLQNIDFKTEFYRHFNILPIRQHVSIGSDGAAKKSGKFDEQVIFKGTRFCFEIEMLSDGNNESSFNKVIEQLHSKTFRIGSGTRCGFGEIKIISCKTAMLDLQVETDLSAYLEKSSSLECNEFWNKKGKETKIEKQAGNWIEYKLELKPDDFFLFGSGFGNDKADITPVTETAIEWNQQTGKCKFNETKILIPATSVKGAIAHRVAFYYNKFNGWFADTPDTKAATGTANKAVKELFGSEDPKNLQRGRVLLSDIIETAESNSKTKTIQHVSIDRFTGGAAKGALFAEEVVCADNQIYALKLMVEKCAIEDEAIRKALHLALRDIVTGMLPLGGGVNRGNGCFTGTLERTDKEVIDYE